MQNAPPRSPTQAPKGYDNFRDGKKSTLRPNSEAPLMIEAFKMLSSGVYSGDEVRKWLNDNKLKISKNTFLRCIRNPVYIVRKLELDYENI